MKKQIIFSQKQIEYLKAKSSEMKALIELLGDVKTYYIPDPFTSLVSQIVYQSISFKAATAIWERFIIRFPDFTPQSIIEIPYDELKGVGLSNSKTKYIYNIAHAFLNSEIKTNFHDLSDDEIITEVTKIKGIGNWTAEMFLIFCLQRENVISYGDIAIRKGLEWLYDIDHKITKDEFAYYQDIFSPYATTASHYLWEITLRNHWNQKKD